MTNDHAALYNALASRDRRFDGVFFVGVTSTGIYCRPICTARTPRASNCRFFESAAAAEKASFRPCLRCRPELAPGRAPVDDAQRIAALVANRIEEGLLDDGSSLEKIAAHFGWSSRQIRRIVRKELGVSPMELVLTRRLLLAKQLLTETELPMSEIAFASGFSSVRRFNDAFGARYGMPPTRLRRAASGAPSRGASRNGEHGIAPRGASNVRNDDELQLSHDIATNETLTLQLSYRTPFDWEGVLRFLAARAIKGVEAVDDGAYLRTVKLGGRTGWIRVHDNREKHALLVEIARPLTPALPALLGRLRDLFDLSARPDVIAERLARDELLGEAVSRNPGLRVPGAFDGFELAVRAILGQQITVKGASTLAGRFAAAFGDAIETPHSSLTHLSPRAERVAEANVDEIAALGIVGARARSIIELAREVASGRLKLEAGVDVLATIEQLVAISGIGQWTAHYIAMRALRWPDAFPTEDVVLRKRLGGVTAARADELSQPWRPWRSYATLHLWRMDHAPDAALTGRSSSTGARARQRASSPDAQRRIAAASSASLAGVPSSSSGV
jgi:AraC family transcriptional regulator of adaptative response / DNA-3-methyladenine glycosylase II